MGFTSLIFRLLNAFKNDTFPLLSIRIETNIVSFRCFLTSVLVKSKFSEINFIKLFLKQINRSVSLLILSHSLIDGGSSFSDQLTEGIGISKF